MSVEFSLTSDLSVEDWHGIVNDTVDKYDLEPYDETDFDEDSSIAFIYGPGSVRGVVLTKTDSGLDVRLSSLSSRLDWKMAFNIMREGLEKGSGELTGDIEEINSVDMLTEENAVSYCLRDFAPSIQSMKANLQVAENVWMPMGNYNVAVDRDDFPDEIDDDSIIATEEKLSARVEIFGEAFQASVFVLKGGARISNWAPIATLVGKVDAVTFQSFDDPPIEGFVQLKDVLEILGDRAISCGDDIWYLPVYDFDQEPELLEALKAKAIEDPAELEVADPQDGDDDDGELDMDEFVEKLEPVILWVCMQIKDRKSADDIRKEMIEEKGVPEDVATYIVGGVMLTFSSFAENEELIEDPEKLINYLIEKEIPAPLAGAIIHAILVKLPDFIDKAGGSETKRGGCLGLVVAFLLAGGALWAFIQ